MDLVKKLEDCNVAFQPVCLSDFEMQLEALESALSLPETNSAYMRHELERLRDVVSAEDQESIDRVLSLPEEDGQWKSVHPINCHPPMDGSFVQVCNIGGHYTYAPTSARWGTYHPNAKGKECWRDASGVKISFTHWRPLPAPPKETV